MSLATTILDRPRSATRWGLAHALPRTAMGKAAKQGDLHSRLVVASEARDPDAQEFWEIVDAIRAGGAMHRGRYALVTASHAVVREVLASNDFSAGVEFAPSGPLAAVGRWAWRDAPIGPLTAPSLLVTDPPDHTRYRKLVTRVFSARAVQQLTGRTQEIADRLLDDLPNHVEADGTVDLVEHFAAMLPVTVIAEILGVPPEDHDMVLRFGAGAAPSLDLGLDWSVFSKVERALRDFDAWLESHLEHVRRHPGDDLLSQLVATRDDESGAGLSPLELKATAGLVLAAGFETTVNLLSNGVALLDQHRDQLDVLRDDASSWPGAVDEILRVDPPVLLTGRTALADTTVAGHQVRRGSIVTTLLAAANRDPEVFDDPETFDVTRANAGDHLSFSSGRHYCLGAALARMEGRVGLESLFGRYPDLKVAPGAARRPTRILRGYERLPVTLG